MRRRIRCAVGLSVALLSCNSLVSVPSVGEARDASLPAPPAPGDASTGSAIVDAAEAGAAPVDAADAGEEAEASDSAAPLCDDDAAAMASDPDNCGSCGHDCLGGACEGGACLPIPLAANVPAALSVAVDETSVYFTQDNSALVSKISKDGGAVTVLSSGPTPWFIAVDKSNVYWTSRTTNAIYYTTLNGELPAGADAGATQAGDAGDAGDAGEAGAPSENVSDLVDAPNSGPYGIATDGTYVYWSEFVAGNVWRTPVGGAHPSAPELVAHAPYPTGITVSEKGLFWLAYSAGYVYRATPGAPTVSQLTRTTNIASRFLATDEENVYWTMSDDNSVWTVPIDGGDTVQISGTESSPWGIVADASGVYWADNGGSIRRARLVNGAWSSVTLADGLGAPTGLAADSVALYWAEHVSGRVMKLAK